MRNTLFLYLLLTSLMAISCREESKKEIKTPEVVFQKEGELSVFKKDSDSLIVQLDIEIAENEYETQTGLMYRKSMEQHQGMLFIFEDERMHSFYMKNTQFPLDLIFIKSDYTAASFQENAQPYDEDPLPSQVPVKYVLEVNAGLVDKWKLAVGDKIEFLKN